MSDPEVLREVGRWLRYAREDLQGAELISEQKRIPRIACFHAQQAAEKAIKTIFVFLQVRFSRTHDLETLCNELPEGWRLAEEPPRFSGLSGWAVEPRYPGDLVDATEQDARNAIEQARSVYEMALEDLEAHGYDRTGEET